MFFPLYIDPANGSAALQADSEHTLEVYPKKSDGTDGCWRWGKEKVSENIAILRGTQVRNKDRWNVSYRVYLNDGDEQRRSTPKSFWAGPQFSTDAATRALASHFPGIDAKKFTPKPIGLLQDIIDQSAGPHDLVVDFFAGSGSFTEAVLMQNQKERTSRPFIVVQLPEPIETKMPKSCDGVTSVSDLAKERIRRVIKKLEAEQAEKTEDAKGQLAGMAEDMLELDLGFKVFKLDSSNIHPWDADFDNLEETLFNSVENIKPDRTEADVLYELLLKYGLDLAVEIEERQVAGKTVSIIGSGALIVCLADDVSLDVVEGIAALKEELQPEVMRVVFKDAGFKDDVVKTNTVQILRQAGIEDVKSL